MISTADGALGEVSSLLQNIKSLVVQAANSGAESSDEIKANQLQIDSILPSTLTKDTGKYGTKLSVTIPQVLQQPVPNVYATLTQFVTSINKTYKGVPYIGLTGCSGGKLHFGGDFTFTDGSVLKAVTTAKCSK